MNKVNDEKTGKPVITELEAERQEAIARQEAAIHAQRSGADPAAIDALMQSLNGHPVIQGRTVLGICDGSYTAAAMVTLGLIESKIAFETTIEKAVADM